MPAVVNRGRLNNFISGITGVQAGGTAVVNMPVNLRAHRLNFQCAAIAYGFGATAPAVTVAGSTGGTGAVITPTVVNGVITALAITNGGSGYSGTITVTIQDGLYTNPDGSTVRIGTGATATATQSAGAINAITLTSGGTVGPVPPEILLTSFKELVNGVNMRDILPLDTRKIMYANPLDRNYTPVLGEFARFYTEPWRNLNQHNELTSWDLFGQNTWQLQIGIASNVTAPSLVGSYEFDYMRNTRPESDGKGNVRDVPFLQPVRQHRFTYPVPSGRFDLTTLPSDFPISRLWLFETNQSTGAALGKGSITQLEVYQDGNKILEATQPQFDQIIAEYGFNVAVFDAAYVADPDQRLFKALRVANNLIVRVYSNAAANLNVVMETLPGSYS